MANVKFSPTPEQLAIKEKFTADPESIQINAVAGAGKTSMLELIDEDAPPGSLALAFNKRNAEDLGVKLTMDASTLNALGHRALMKFIGGRFDPMANAVRDLVGQTTRTEPDLKECYSDLTRLIDLAKNAGMADPKLLPGNPKPLIKCSPGAWQDIIETHHLNLEDFDPDFISDIATKILHDSYQSALKGKGDFQDQLALPVLYRTPLQPRPCIFVDESQDLSPIQIQLISQARPGRVLALGDPHQAIYGFRGADLNAFNELASRFNCSSLPLSFTFRCPHSVVFEAQRIVPHIKAPSWAKEGLVDSIPYDQIINLVSGSAIICRNNAPLVKVAFKFIQARKPFTFLGRDFGAGLKSALKKATKDENLLSAEAALQIKAYFQQKIHHAESTGKSTQFLEDQQSSLLVLLEECRDCSEVISAITQIFEAKGGGVTICTVHKAKGSEWPHIVFLNTWKLINKPRDQDSNIYYVGVTRAQERLSFCETD